LGYDLENDVDDFVEIGHGAYLEVVELRGRVLARGPGPKPRKLAYAPRSLQTWVTKKQTVTPIATGMSVATVVHFALRVSL